MRCTGLEGFVLPFFVVSVMCQSVDDDYLVKTLLSKLTVTTTTVDYDEINLDPVSEETYKARNDISESKIKKEPEVVTCTLKNNESGVCVTYYLCDHDSKSVIEDGYTIIDVRDGGPCPSFLMACCRRNQVLENKPTGKGSAEDDGIINSEWSQIFQIKQQGIQAKCGWSNKGVSALRDLGVTDVNVADYGEFPWMVAVLKRTQPEEEWDSQNYIGGGSLIHPSVVITVAHKLKKWSAEQLKIRAGEYDTVSNQELYSPQERDVSKIVIHSDYYRRSLYNDIALMFLEQPVELQGAPHIGIGCLGKSLPPPNTSCFSMGWGAADFNNKTIFAPILKKVKLPIVGKEDCVSMLRQTRLGPLYDLHSSLTCAGGLAGVDTCKGDGGSPLVCSINDQGTRFAIFGMVAYGISCGVADVPAVYVNTPHFYDWVGQQLEAFGYDRNSFVYQ